MIWSANENGGGGYTPLEEMQQHISRKFGSNPGMKCSKVPTDAGAVIEEHLLELSAL